MMHLLFSRQGMLVQYILEIVYLLLLCNMNACVSCIVLGLQWALLELKSVKKLQTWY
jgi:hypothetical protein